MTVRGAAHVAVLVGAATLLGGCYTALRVPYSPVAAPVEERYEAAEVRSDEGFGGDYLTPRVGRFSERDGYDDYWGYGSGPYGYGYPAYDTRYGLGAYGLPFSPYYGYSPYYSGYGPYGYGYDPYYYGGGGRYVPPGYELVTSNELDQLRADSHALQDLDPGASQPSQAEIDRRRRQAAQRAEQAWERRVDTPQRKTPQTTRRPATTTSVTTTTKAPSTSSTTKPAATQSSGSKRAKDRKKRR